MDRVRVQHTGDAPRRGRGCAEAREHGQERDPDGIHWDAGNAAPTLNTVTLERDEARELFDRVIRNLDLLLTLERIHGDLSAYNILYWDGDITLIDFPQVTFTEANPSSWVIFLRDVTRVCQYFRSQGVKCDARKLAADLWTSHGHQVVKDVHPLYLDGEKKEDRRLWQKQKSATK